MTEEATQAMLLPKDARLQKQVVLTVGDFELSLKYPVDAQPPADIDRLLKGVARKVEEWARSCAKH